VQSFEPYDPTDISVGGGLTGACGDSVSECTSGYTFMRGGTPVRSTADQQDKSHDYVYVVYDPSIPGTEVATGTTYGSVTSEDLPAQYHQNVGSQSGIYFFRLDGAKQAADRPRRRRPPSTTACCTSTPITIIQLASSNTGSDRRADASIEASCQAPIRSRSAVSGKRRRHNAGKSALGRHAGMESAAANPSLRRRSDATTTRA